MDPLTAALNVVNNALTLAVRIWDATPADQQAIASKDWAKFTHNIGAFITSIQDKINSAAHVA